MIEAETEVSEPGPQRIFFGWIWLAAVLGVMIFFSLASSLRPAPKGGPSDTASYDLQLKTAVSQRQLMENAVSVTGSKKQSDDLYEQGRSMLDNTIADLVESSRTDPEAARYYGVFRIEQGADVPAANLAPLLKSRDPKDQVLAKIFAAKKLTAAEAEKAVKSLPDDPFVYKVAKAEALEKAGDKVGRNSMFTGNFMLSLVVAFMVGFVILLGSVICWGVYAWAKSSKKLVPLGPPLGAISLHDADRLATRAAQVLSTFLVLSVVGALLAHRSPGLGGLLTPFGILISLPILALVPIDGKRISLRAAGFNFDRFGRNFLWGVCGFLVEYPIAIAMMLLGAAVFRFLPAPSHPAAEELQKAKDILSLLPILFFGSIAAPLWEEFVFRGMIFPALNRVLGKVVSAAVITGFLFAMGHPQGIALWCGLATVGTVGCALTYQTKSLVPTIVMHFLHNSVTFGLALLMMASP